MVLTAVITLLFFSYAFLDIRVYFNRSIDSPFATPNNVAKGNVDLRGKLITRIDTATYSIDVSIGWNMIGSLPKPVPIGNIVQVLPRIVVSPFYEFTGSAYQVATVLIQ